MQVIYFPLIIKVFLIILFRNVYGQHPYGNPVSLLSIKNEAENGDIDTNTDYQVNYDGLKEVLDHPEVKDRYIVIVSVIGAYRQGKSFFLDYCLRFLYSNYRSVNTLNHTFIKNGQWWGEPTEPLTGFSWKHGREGETKGILLWSDVFLHEQNNEKIAIVLMDTQGLFELEADANLDARVFGITSLISSVQIFNIKGYIEENQLQYLKMVTDFSKLANERQEVNVINNKTKVFQNLLFLFRDYPDESDGLGFEGGALYLQRFLNEVRKGNKVAQNVRNGIKESYENINAMLLPYPGRIISAARYDGRWGPLDDDFKENFKTLIESIFTPENLTKKKVFGKEVKASDMTKYTATVFTTFKQPELPNINSVFDITVAAEMNNLIDDAVNEYTQTMASRLDYSKTNFISSFIDDHKVVQLAVVGKFRQKQKMADIQTEKNAEKIITTKIDDYFNKWKNDVFKTHAEYMVNKIRKEEAEKRAKEELERQVEINRKAAEARLRAELEQQYRRHPNHRAGFWLCKIFTLGIHKCK